MLRRRITILLLVGALCFAVYRNVTFFTNRRAGTLEAEALPGRCAPSEKDGPERARKCLSPADRIRFASGMGRDPFGFELRSDGQGNPGGTATSAGLLQLNAVLKSPQRKLALINGRIYSEGDVVAGRRITRIDHNRVFLTGGGDGLVIELDQSL